MVWFPSSLSDPAVAAPWLKLFSLTSILFPVHVTSSVPMSRSALPKGHPSQDLRALWKKNNQFTVQKTNVARGIFPCLPPVVLKHYVVFRDRCVSVLKEAKT